MGFDHKVEEIVRYKLILVIICIWRSFGFNISANKTIEKSHHILLIYN